MAKAEWNPEANRILIEILDEGYTVEREGRYTAWTRSARDALRLLELLIETLPELGGAIEQHHARKVAESLAGKEVTR